LAAQFLFLGSSVTGCYPHAPNHFGKYPTEELDSQLYFCGATIRAMDFPFPRAEENLQKGAKLVVMIPAHTAWRPAEMYLPYTARDRRPLALATDPCHCKREAFMTRNLSRIHLRFRQANSSRAKNTLRMARRSRGSGRRHPENWPGSSQHQEAGIYQAPALRIKRRRHTESRGVSILQVITNINFQAVGRSVPDLLSECGVGVEEIQSARTVSAVFEVGAERAPMGGDPGS